MNNSIHLNNMNNLTHISNIITKIKNKIPIEQSINISCPIDDLLKSLDNLYIEIKNIKLMNKSMMTCNEYISLVHRVSDECIQLLSLYDSELVYNEFNEL